MTENLLISSSAIKIHPADNLMVALKNLSAGYSVTVEEDTVLLKNEVPAKHKFTLRDIAEGEMLYMYGVIVGVANTNIEKGSSITIKNIRHASADFSLKQCEYKWIPPLIEGLAQKTFDGYHRSNGAVGTANYWVVLPLVFCENKNVEVLKDIMLEKLGYKKTVYSSRSFDEMINLYKAGYTIDEIMKIDFETSKLNSKEEVVFKNIDGVKFLTHSMGCGCTIQDAKALCGLLAGYVTHPNVAGATILSLGCQQSQVSFLKDEIESRDPSFTKPLVIIEQQQVGTEDEMIKRTIKETFVGLIKANENIRKPAPISKLCVGLECGGSDGFSGISANPAVGYVSDLLVSAGASVILSEFPELCGVEQELSDRCVSSEVSEKFVTLMRSYNEDAVKVGSGFYANPSPGNIRDGLITDAIKSAGAAKKGGTSPVVDVLDYPEPVTKPGLNLLCTPGSDVESTTAEVGSGANLVLFTTGLGTPTGNPVSPVVKISTNTELYKKMNDIIDINCGSIIDGEETIEQAGERILDYMLLVASGKVTPKAVLFGQEDFIPWKRQVSL